MKDSVPLEWARDFLGDNKNKSLQAHFQTNPFFRFAFISLALLSQVIGLVLVCVIGIFIGSFLLSFLR